jgi:acyl-CoA dehydrogenase
MNSNPPRPAFMDEELRIFEDSVIKFLDDKAPPERVARWRENGMVERSFWREAGEGGLLGVSISAEYGGAGGDFRHDYVLVDQVSRRDVSGFSISLHNGIVMPYIKLHGDDAQRRRWLPKLASGEYVGAIAMSEPGAGSDLQGMRTTAVRDGDGYVINGQKTFISNGQLADFIIVAAKTDPKAGSKGISLFVVIADTPGFRRGRKLDKMGMEAQDTSELFFDDVRVPADALIGLEEGRGLKQLMAELPKERLIIAIGAAAMIERALETTIEYVKDRKAFGKRIVDFQNTQFQLADCATEATIARVFINHCIERLLAGELDPITAAKAKLWTTELQGRVVDACLQLHGGYGYINDYLISRMYKDARISRIFGGTSEIMRLVIGRSL